MREFLRNTASNLPNAGQTTLISRQTPAGPQMFSLSAVSLDTSSNKSTTEDLSDFLSSLDNNKKHDHKE